MLFTKFKAFFYVWILLQAAAVHCNKTTFSRAHAAVLFNTFYPDEGTNKSYNPEDLIPMNSLVASKFTKISTTVQDKTVINETSAVVIPSAVAIYNRFHLKPGKSPLELFVTFSINNIPNGTATNSTPDGWNSFINILDEANNNFPEAVKRIYIEHFGILTTIASLADELEFTKFENYFAAAQFRKSEKCELGISLIIVFCDSAGVLRLLERFRHISFCWWPNFLDDDKNDELPVAIQRFLGIVSFCKRKIEKNKK